MILVGGVILLVTLEIPVYLLLLVIFQHPEGPLVGYAIQQPEGKVPLV
jgi:hypothetical protein